MKTLELTNEEFQAAMTAIREQRNSDDDAAKNYRHKWRLKPYECEAIRYHENASRQLTSVLKKMYEVIDGG